MQLFIILSFTISMLGNLLWMFTVNTVTVCPVFLINVLLSVEFQLSSPLWVLFWRRWSFLFSLRQSLTSFTLHCRRSSLIERPPSKMYGCLCMCGWTYTVCMWFRNIIKAILIYRYRMSTFRPEWISFSWWWTPRKTMTPVNRNRQKVTHTYKATHRIYTHIKAQVKAILNHYYLRRFKRSWDPFSSNDFPLCWLRNQQHLSHFFGLQSGDKPSYHETAAGGGRRHLP